MSAHPDAASPKSLATGKSKANAKVKSKRRGNRKMVKGKGKARPWVAAKKAHGATKVNGADVGFHVTITEGRAEPADNTQALEALRFEAQQLEKVLDWQQLDRVLTEAIALSPASSTLYLRRSRVRIQTRRLEWALRDARRALQLHCSFEARVAIVVALLAQLRCEEAIDDLEAMLQETSNGTFHEAALDDLQWSTAASAIQGTATAEATHLANERQQQLRALLSQAMHTSQRSNPHGFQYLFDEAKSSLAWQAMRHAQPVHVIPIPDLSAGPTCADAAGVGAAAGAGGERTWPADVVRLVCISDTHGQHRSLDIPPGDILVHAGDITQTGQLSQLKDFGLWLSQLPHKHKVVIAGNHDTTLQPSYYKRKGARRFHNNKPHDVKACRAALTDNCTYLEDTSVVLEGLRFYGAPWQPTFFDWAFNVTRGSECRGKWEAIPWRSDQDDAGDTAVDVLITHGPPVGHGDNGHDLPNAGCVDLLFAVQQWVKPRVHIFGHIHGGYGASSDGQTVYVNAATCQEDYSPNNRPIVVDVPRRASQRMCALRNVPDHSPPTWIAHTANETSESGSLV